MKPVNTDPSPAEVRATAFIRERCAKNNHTERRSDGQCLCGVFYIGGDK